MILSRGLMLSAKLLVACCFTGSLFGSNAAVTNFNNVLVVGVAGGTGSGKTTFARALVEQLTQSGIKAVHLSHDFYYKVLSHLSLEERAKVNFDEPDALESSLLAEHLLALKRGKPIERPEYDFSTHSRVPHKAQKVEPACVVVVDGILLFAAKELIHLFDVKIFVDTPDDVRYDRRKKRDMVERGRTEQSVEIQIETTVKPMHDLFVKPCKKLEEVTVISGQTDNSIFINWLHIDLINRLET